MPSFPMVCVFCGLDMDEDSEDSSGAAVYPGFFAAKHDLKHLRPLSALEMFDRVFSVLRTQPVLFAQLGLLYSLQELVVAVYFLGRGNTDVEELPSLLSFLLLVPLFLRQWTAAAIVAVAFQACIFPQRPLSLWTAMRASFQRLPSLILTRILVMLILFTVGVLVPAILLRQAASGGVAVFSAGLAAWTFMLAAYLACVWSLISCVVVVERRAFMHAMMRSVELMRTRFGSRWAVGTAVRRLLLVLLFPATVWLVGQVAVQAASLAITGGLTYELEGGRPVLVISSLWVLIANALNSLFVPFILGPFTFTALVVLYTECRMRREALDLQVRLLAKGHPITGQEGMVPDQDI